MSLAAGLVPVAHGGTGEVGKSTPSASAPAPPAGVPARARCAADPPQHLGLRARRSKPASSLRSSASRCAMQISWPPRSTYTLARGIRLSFHELHSAGDARGDALLTELSTRPAENFAELIHPCGWHGDEVLSRLNPSPAPRSRGRNSSPRKAHSPTSCRRTATAGARARPRPFEGGACHRTRSDRAEPESGSCSRAAV